MNAQSRSKKLSKRCEWYIRHHEPYGLFASELGWQEWMLDYCADESSRADGGELTVRDSQNIDKVLNEAWDIAEARIER